MGGKLLGCGTQWKTGGLSEEVCYTIHSLHGLPRSRANQATWECAEVLWTGYVHLPHVNLYQTYVLLQLKVLKKTTTTPNIISTQVIAMTPVERSSVPRRGSRNWTLPVGDRRGHTPNTTPNTGVRRLQPREPEQEVPPRRFFSFFFLSTGFSQSHLSIQGVHH